ncbi:putative TPR repeat:RNA-processing protein [Desulforapulum autotrophicum HRM2]|uniref:TPR repeat:RNA-processing protein n=1 Tax=Desulforapulum autotrophicum (strain ATCC 43914 / DSM 3382 / VKM B-1955 / HRM2) TaxID=177437 RepID=C0QI09_DESAH|nr:tetratricopeptide repeat protein [Desulforapulum autotrophicum]ACN15745.1 putative TPR repeat:RNA-processing protein [Desulforapulum autotrophicum HRM2]
MGLFSFFSGKTPEAIEAKGDQLVERNAFGPGKLEYEKAAARNRVSPSKDPDFTGRIEQKIGAAKHSLALEHFNRAQELVEAGCFDDAADRLDLAATLTTDTTLLDAIQAMGNKKDMPVQHPAKNGTGTPDNAPDPNGPVPDEIYSNEPYSDDILNDGLDVDETEVFEALVNALPPEEQAAYPLYGPNFIKGFVSMNQGDFQGASTAFTTALDEHGSQTSFVHLELATCLVNLNQADQAKDLVLEFIDAFPTSVRGWQILGETLWSLEEFDQALDRFAACPESITQTTDMEILRGETLIRSNRIKEAQSLYQGLLKAGNRDDAILRHLAMACERLGDHRTANELYLELINHCSRCGARPDDSLRLRFAETCITLGDYSDKLLDIYLDLAVKDPENKGRYFQRVSQIYAALGEETQAQRFNGFARENSHPQE